MVLSLLGCLALLTGCDYIRESLIVEYGTPTADFELKGIVTDKQTDKPIEGIQVVRLNPSSDLWEDTVYTNLRGKYEFHFQDFSVADQYFEIKVEDVDGSVNGGEFKTTTKDVYIEDYNWIKEPEGNWYDGKAVKTQNFELDKK